MTEVLHIKSEDMRFARMHPNAGGYASIARLINPNNSQTIGAGIGTYDGCSIEWTMGVDEVVVVLDGLLRVRTGEGYNKVIEAKPGDVVWMPKGTKMKYEGDKAKMFYCLYPSSVNVPQPLEQVFSQGPHPVGTPEC